MPSRPDLPGAVVFDFDGVIVNSEPLHLRTFQGTLADLGIALSDRDYYDKYLGYTDEEAFQAAAADAGRPLSAADLRALIDRKTALMPELLAEPGILFPDAADCIARLAAHVPLAIASGAIREEIELVLDGAGLRRYFRTIVAAGETPRSKPAPDPYARAVDVLREQGDLPANGRPSVAIEDSHWGLLSAARAGLRTVAVTSSYGADELTTADRVVARLAELTIEDIWTLMQRA
ncbi:MAG: HAD family phosphatase [Vicinamibacterales bacterium]